MMNRTERSGKTQAVLLSMVNHALRHPRGRYAYIALNRDIVWRELEDINDRYGLNLHFVEHNMQAVFPNGAELQLYAAG